MVRRNLPDEEALSAAPPAWMKTGATPPADDDQEIWLLSYSDMVTLLFSVFVMLMAITTVKEQLPKEPPPPAAAADTVEATATATEATETAEAALPAPVAPPAPPPVPPDDSPRLGAEQMAVTAPEPLSRRWLARIAELGLPPGVVVQVRDRRISLDIGAAALFPSGQAELTEDGRRMLGQLAPALRQAPGDIAVEGHTDATPIATLRFPSNWELSAARAAVVVRALADAGVAAERLSAVGYADTRPLAFGADPDSLARNRRVTLSLRPPEADSR